MEKKNKRKKKNIYIYINIYHPFCLSHVLYILDNFLDAEKLTKWLKVECDEVT